MFRTFFIKIANSNDEKSLANIFRRKRFQLFEKLFFEELSKQIRIIDIGGTQDFWVKIGYHKKQNIHITIVNLSVEPIKHPNMVSIAADARKMPQFGDSSFDIAFSNSVIEHVGNFDDQISMANEIRRIGKSYFVQTPNYWFPIEPHFLFVGYQFLPIFIRAFLLRRYNLGWYMQIKDKDKSIEIAKSINLLTKNKLRRLFPHANMFSERLFSLTKSIVVFEKQQGI